jgi:hypothetical protein
LGCLITLVAFLFPRLTLIVMAIFTDWIGRSFDWMVIPFLGWFFMPYTTLAYIAAQLHGGLQDWWIVLFILAILADVVSSRPSVKIRTEQQEL